MIKIPTMFVRDESQKGHPVIAQIKPECQWVLDGEGVPTRKLDGMNVKIETGKLYKRQKPKERDYDNASYVECEPLSPNDKYLFDALAHTKDKSDGIYEAIGPKIQGNPEKAVEHKLVSVVPFDPVLMIDGLGKRDFESLKIFFEEHDMEGIVFHHADGRMAKIKAKDFGIRRGPPRLGRVDMDIKLIKERLEEIEALKEDDESAHSQEDALWQDVLEYISQSEIHPYAEMAQEALKSKNIKFERWCA